MYTRQNLHLANYIYPKIQLIFQNLDLLEFKFGRSYIFPKTYFPEFTFAKFTFGRNCLFPKTNYFPEFTLVRNYIW